MNKLVPLFLGLALLFAGGASAQYQFNYNFTVQTGQPYAPLTTADTMNGTLANNDVIYLRSIFASLPYDRQNLDTVVLLFENIVLNRFFGTQVSPASGFQFTNADLTDKGFFDSTTTQSPIRFSFTGAAPARILKIEMTNMGFVEEHNLYGTLNDYANIQFILYESTGIVELRYGPSQISHYHDYFSDSTMQVGLYNNISLVTDAGMFYYLSGNPSSPAVDSVEYALSEHIPALTGWPAAGTVYRFTPKSLGVGTITGNVSLNVFPTLTRSNLNVTYGDAGTADYSIRSLTGAQLQNGVLQSGKNTLDVTTLPAGNYILQARNSSGQGTFRFTKQ